MTRRRPKVLVESSEVLPLVDIEIAFSTGSLMDPLGLEGLAQLTGQLLRRGPRGMSAKRFEERLALLGARMAIDTAMRSMRVRATTLRRNLEPLFALISEVVWAPALRGSDFSKLKRQAQAALISRLDDDQALGATHFRRELFGSHPYARSTGGTAQSVQAISLEDVTAFYERCVAHQPFVVGVSGDIGEQEARRLVELYFPRPSGVKRRMPQVPATKRRRGRHVVIVDKPERTQTQLFIGTLGARTKDPDLFSLIVSNTAFGGTFTGPLMQEVRANRGWSYGAFSRLMHSRRRDAWYMWSAPSAEYAAECASLQLRLLEDWVEQGLDKRTIRFAKQYLINSHCFDLDTPSKRLEARLDVEVLGVPPHYVDHHDELVAGVAPEQAHEATRRRISPRDLVVVAVATADDSLAHFEAIPGVKSVDVVPYRRI